MDKKKKTLLWAAGIIEAAIIVFGLVVSILVIVTFNSPEEFPSTYKELNLAENGPMIGYFQNNATVFFLVIVLPLLVILALDIVYLVYFALKRESKLSDSERKIIAEKAKEEAKAELLKELEQESTKK